VHGEEEALKIKATSEAIFANKGNTTETETKDIDPELVKKGINIIELLVMSELFTSKSEARRMIEQNAVSINEQKITDVNTIITEKDFINNEMIIQKGKKTFIKIRI
ncbi:MAG TPA: S4 domain-containing protein, partial [Bacilli bacterium]|nr:S4 domain-containing protein [Bacilli bacterium]